MHLVVRFAFQIVCSLLFGAVGLAYSQESLSLKRQDQKLVEMTVYTPSSSNCRGIGVISPGAGGTGRGYRYLAETMSSLGFLTVVVSHQESGRRALREYSLSTGLRIGLAELLTEPNAYRGRFMDIAAAKRWTRDRCQIGPSVLIGHSMGSATIMMEAGARNKLGLQGADSFSVYIALSPQGAGSVFPENAWSEIQKPVLMLTGTRDTELSGASWQIRTEPFKSMPPGCKWLGIINGASHLNFSSKGMSRKTEVLVSATIRNFLNSISRGDCSPPAPVQGMKLMTK